MTPFYNCILTQLGLQSKRNHTHLEMSLDYQVSVAPWLKGIFPLLDPSRQRAGDLAGLRLQLQHYRSLVQGFER